MKLPTNPMLWAWLSLLFTSQSSYELLGGGGRGKACWCCTGILLEGENEKRRKQSCLRYIYTIGCKSFLMGSRVQSWGRDYQGKSGYGVTCIWPGLALDTPPRCTLAYPGHGWSWGGEEVRPEVRVAKPRRVERWVWQRHSWAPSGFLF